MPTDPCATAALTPSPCVTCARGQHLDNCACPCHRRAATATARLPRVWEGWPDDLPGILREAAKRLEQHPWLKPIEGLRLWADVLDYERQISEAEEVPDV